EGIKTGGYIDDFWVRNANIKDAEVSARIRDIEAKRIVGIQSLSTFKIKLNSKSLSFYFSYNKQINIYLW
ncbi:9604_t:CDS:1, partial [Entrophospora sp. SA101]